MSRGQYGKGFLEGKKSIENLIKEQKVITAIVAALAFVGGLIVKGLGNK